MSLGRILYKLYYKPVGNVRHILKTGIMRTWKQNKGRREMETASEHIRELHFEEKETFQIYFLTGKKYWYQTAFCLYSLQKHAKINIKATIVDDGSFDEELESQVKKQFPSSEVIRKATIETLLDNILPESRYPNIRKRRIEYPHLRKLTDVHVLTGKDWKIVLDSDMLFFNPPQDILEWYRKPEKMLFMADIEESYGYPISYLQSLAGTNDFPSKLNVGITGIPSSSIDWDKMEFWIGDSIDKYGKSYLQEQGLTAALAARHGYLLLPEESYKVMPIVSQNYPPEILHHYVADSKFDYFVKGWKKVL